MIPRIIHCCWFGGPKTKLALKCRASWEKFAPAWEIREFVLPQEVPAFVSEALKAKKWAVVSDWARMQALYDDGGVYLDYDVELVRPFVPPEGEWVAGEWTASGGTWMNPGSGIALEKGSLIARQMLEAYAQTAFDPRREMMPWINDRLAEAIALVEDREENRAEVRANCPEVAVFDEQAGVADLLAACAPHGGLGTRRRIAYREEMARRRRSRGMRRRFSRRAS